MLLIDDYKCLAGRTGGLEEASLGKKLHEGFIDPGSSVLFVHERLAQYLCLLCSKKNALVEGVAGASTHT